MRVESRKSTTSENLDWLAEFLTQEREHPTLSAHITSGAHLFRGSFDNENLTLANLKLATDILLGMALGYVEDAPLMMIFKHKDDHEEIIDLSSESQKKLAQSIIQGFREQSHEILHSKINDLETS